MRNVLLFFVLAIVFGFFFEQSLQADSPTLFVRCKGCNTLQLYSPPYRCSKCSRILTENDKSIADDFIIEGFGEIQFTDKPDAKIKGKDWKDIGLFFIILGIVFLFTEYPIIGIILITIGAVCLYIYKKRNKQNNKVQNINITPK